MVFKSIYFVKALVFASLLNQKIGGLFVSIGEYPDHLKYGINDDKCGLRYEIPKYSVKRSQKCFNKNAGNTTVTVMYNTTGPKSESIQTRIGYGMDAQEGEAPWTVSLQAFTVKELDNGKWIGLTHRCTGSLITMQWVLTASHCLPDNTPDVTIYVGSNKYKSEIFMHLKQPRWFRHPNWTDSKPSNYQELNQNDLALLHLYEEFPRNVKSFVKSADHLDRPYDINTICLPNKNQYNSGEEMATAFGFGYINHERFPDTLMKGQFDLVPHHMCAFHDKIICSETLYSRICGGDSGGPLVQYSELESRAIQVGVTDASDPWNATCLHTHSSYWISVSLHIDWILETISSNSS